MSVSVHTYIHSDLFSDVFLGARGGGGAASQYTFLFFPLFISLFSFRTSFLPNPKPPPNLIYPKS